MLTADQLAALAAQLRNDPKARGYAAHLLGDPARVVDLLNAQTETMVKVIHGTTAQAWAATGPMAAIVDTGATVGHACRASCLLVQTSLAAGTDVHMERPDVQAMFDGWLDAKVITQAQHDDLYARARQPASPAEVLGLPVPDARDVLNAWGV